MEQNKQLPIYFQRDELLETVKQNQFTIVTGDTGLGKSTQIPQFLMEAGLHGTKKIGITQPRRALAISLATRVAKERGVELGTTVGYAIRFEQNCGESTVIKYMTDGMLVRECLQEPNFDTYSVIIIDEADKRSININVCSGLLKRAARNRPDLKVIIISAPAEDAAFSKYFNNALIFNVSGKGSKKDDDSVEKSRQPEITSCNLQPVVLALISMGISNPLDFEFLDPPPANSIKEAIEHLQELGALDSSQNLTPLGRRMSEFPLEPQLTKTLLKSEDLGCSNKVLKIVSLLSTQYQNLFPNNKEDDSKKFQFESSDDGGDMITLLNVYNAWEKNNYSEDWCKSVGVQHEYLKRAEEIRKQLMAILESSGTSTTAKPSTGSKLSENIRRAFTAGYFRQVARKVKGTAYHQILGDQTDDIFLHPSSFMSNTKRPRLVICHEIVKTSKPFMCGVIAIEPEWIQEYAPAFAKKFPTLADLDSPELDDDDSIDLEDSEGIVDDE